MTHDHDNQIKVIVQKKEIQNDVNLCFTPCVDVVFFVALNITIIRFIFFVWYYLLHKVQKILTFITFTLQREGVFVVYLLFCFIYSISFLCHFNFGHSKLEARISCRMNKSLFTFKICFRRSKEMPMITMYLSYFSNFLSIN